MKIILSSKDKIWNNTFDLIVHNSELFYDLILQQKIVHLYRTEHFIDFVIFIRFLFYNWHNTMIKSFFGYKFSTFIQDNLFGHAGELLWGADLISGEFEGRRWKTKYWDNESRGSVAVSSNLLFIQSSAQTNPLSKNSYLSIQYGPY